MILPINTDEEMIQYAHSIKYMVIFPDKSIKHYSSLRKIAKDICVDHTTISKKLGENNPCICKSQNNNCVFYIRKL